LDDGGPGGLIIDGNYRAQSVGYTGAQTAFDAADVTFGIADVTIRNVGFSGIVATNAKIDADRVLIEQAGQYSYGGFGIRLVGGTLSLDSSTIRSVGTGIRVDGTEAEIINSTIGPNRADYSVGIDGRGEVLVRQSNIVDNGAITGAGIDLEGRLEIQESTLAGNGTLIGAFGSAVRIDGELVLINSTIADTATGTDDGGAAAIVVTAGSKASIVNSTITGTFVSDSGMYEPIDGTSLYAGNGSTVRLSNTIVDGSIVGTIASNGANTFRDAVVTGAVAGDQLNVAAEDVFATTREIGTTGIRSGVLADNGGPTHTVALLNSPDNPALDAADAADAPLFDQRGVPRDATPDIGAFELGPTTLPPLAEGVPVLDEAINGVPREALTLTGGRNAAISFVDEYAGFQNSLGVYLVGPDGEITAPRWVFERIEHALPDDSVDPSVRPGGGPSQPGDTVWLSDLYDPAELQEGTEFGLFLVADGAVRNPFIVFDGGTLEFRSGGGVATVTDRTPELVHIAESGAERALLGDIMHTVDAGSPNPLSNALNPPAVRYPTGGRGQALSGLLDGEFTIAFEDQPLNFGDRDFNDLLVAVELLDASPALFAAPASAGDTVSAVASLETLVVAGETAA
jgi:hypothetical protein